MSLIVSSIVGGINEQNSIVKNVCADDWTAKLAITASDESYTVAIQVIQESTVQEFCSILGPQN